MRRVVVGLVGPIASGKGFLGHHLEEKGFGYFSLSDRVREEVDRRGLPRRRETLIDTGNDLRLVFGLAICATRTVQFIPADAELVVIDAIRNPGELIYLREKLGALIIGVDAPVELRLQWYLERAKQRGEDGVTAEDFYRVNARDQGQGEADYGQQGAACLSLADFVVSNDGTDKFLRESLAFLKTELGLDLEGKRKDKEKI